MPNRTLEIDLAESSLFSPMDGSHEFTPEYITTLKTRFETRLKTTIEGSLGIEVSKITWSDRRWGLFLATYFMDGVKEKFPEELKQAFNAACTVAEDLFYEDDWE